jgi:protein tyrosine kinase modulator
MKNIQNLQLSEYLDILKRRILLIIAFAVLAGVTSFFVLKRLPDIYESETLILIEAPKIPSEYVRPTTTGSIENRLSTINQQIMSRTRLERIILENNLYHEQRSKMPMESVVERMRDDIGLSVIRSDSFKVTYQSSDPLTAQKVAGEIATLYIEESLKGREELTEDVNDFLEGQLDETESKLRQQEEKLSSFKMQYIGALPEQQTAILATLDRLQKQLQASTDSVNKLEEQKAYQERLYPEFKTLSTLSVSNSLPLAIESAVQTSPLTSELESKKSQRDSLLGRYTPDHPDIRKLDLEIAALEKKHLSSSPPRKVPSAPSTSEAKVENDPSESDQVLAKAELQNDLETINRQIAQAKREQEKIRNEMTMYQARIDSVPRMEQMEKQITRDYDITRQHYQSMLAKKNDATMAASLEKRQKGEQFRVLDPASLPQKPSRPDRLKLNLMGVLIGLALGFGISVVLELKDGSVRTKHEVIILTHLPVLATIPPFAAGVAEQSIGSRERGRNGILRLFSTK